MKHSPGDRILDPAEIGKSVRTSVEALLRDLSSAIAPEFPDRIEKLGANIARWGSKMNLTAHPDDPQEIAFHIIDSLMPVVLAGDGSSLLAGQFASDQRVLDVGSGAGFPGLVLAAASSATFTLVESRRKRASFLQVAAAEMGLKNAKIEGRRVEEIGLAEQYDLVTARAFGDPKEFFALAARALKPGGLAMMYANPSQLFGSDIVRVPYCTAREGVKVSRILAICRQPVEQPRARN